MDITLVPLLILLVPLMLVSALCAATETALFSLSYSDRLRLRRRSPGAADAVASLLAHPRALLVSILLVTNIVNVAYYVISSVIALSRNPEHTPGRRALIGIGVSAGLVLALILLSDLLPKLIARRLRVEFCLGFARPALAVLRTVEPVQRGIESAVIVPLARLFRPRTAPAPTLTVDELSALLMAGAREGAIRTEEQSLLEEVVQLGAVRVRDAMTPRLEIPWLDVEAAAADLLIVLREHDRARVVLCRGNLDGEVRGWVDAKRVLSAWAASGVPPRLQEFARPTLYVPETARLDQLLDLVRQTRRYAALCVDEYGSIVGMIEIDDVLSRLIGETAAEAEGENEDLRAVGPGTWEVPGRFGVRELSEVFQPPGGPRLTIRGRPVERRVATVAGLILLALGRLPRVGDEVRFGNLILRVESMRGRTIDRVQIRVDEPARAGVAGVAP